VIPKSEDELQVSAYYLTVIPKETLPKHLNFQSKIYCDVRHRVRRLKIAMEEKSLNKSLNSIFKKHNLKIEKEWNKN
jgi:hypothetical protein